MKKAILILIMFASTQVFAQTLVKPSLSGFTNTTQRNQLESYVKWAMDSSEKASKLRYEKLPAVNDVLKPLLSQIKILRDSVQLLQASATSLKKSDSTLNTNVWITVKGLRDTVTSFVDKVNKLPSVDTSWKTELSAIKEALVYFDEELQSLIKSLNEHKLWIDEKQKSFNTLIKK